MATKTVKLVSIAGESKKSLAVDYCDDFFGRLRGLMFRKSLPPNWGLLLVQARESRLDAAIHMLWMRFPIAVIWFDANMKVVDARIAHPWRSFLVPSQPAQYILETAPAYMGRIEIGDEFQLQI